MEKGEQKEKDFEQELQTNPFKTDRGGEVGRTELGNYVISTRDQIVYGVPD